MNPIIQSIEDAFVESKHVTINLDKARDFAQGISIKDLKPWYKYSPANLSRLLDLEERLAFLFVFNAISFSYWGEPKWAIERFGKNYNRGTWSMIEAINRAIDEKVPILNSSYLSEISSENLGKVLRGNVQIPLLDERAEILREIGGRISKRYNGRFFNLVESDGDIEGNAISLMEKIVIEFPSFNDSSVYQDKSVYFHKRAQLLVNDINELIFSNDLIFRQKLEDANQLTACADYILPMVLRYYGILEYSPDLTSKVDRRVELQKNSSEETEIRAGTLMAVELIKKNMRNPEITSMILNDYLWLLGDKVPPDHHYHLTRTTAY